MGFSAFVVVVIVAGGLLAYFLLFRGCSLVWSDEILGLACVYRVIWIDGRYGGGKTSLAHMMAYELMRHRGYKRLISNVGSVWRDKPASIVPDEKGRLNAVVILDEGGLFIDTPAKSKKFKTALRKLNCVVITPSVEPPGGGMKFVTIQRALSWAFLGLPLDFYKWDLKKGMTRVKGSFMWWRPSGIYGIYQTEKNPMSDAGIAGLLISMASRLDVRDDDYLYSDDALGVDSDQDAGADQFGDLLEVARSFSESAEAISDASASIVGSRRRRR